MSESAPRSLAGSEAKGESNRFAWRALAVRALPVPIALALVLLFDLRLFTAQTLVGLDWFVHWRYFDWTRTALCNFHTLPLWMSDAYRSADLAANPSAPIFGVLVWALAFLSASAYLKVLIALYSTIGLLGMYALLRDLGTDRAIALPFAVIFAFNGFFFAHISVGHHWSLGSYLLPAVLGSFRRALDDRRWIWLASGLTVAGLFDGQHHPCIWNIVAVALFAVAIAAERRSVRPLLALVLFVAAISGLGAIRILPMFAEFSTYDPLLRFPAMPLGLLWRSLAGRGNDLGTLPVGFWEYDFYVGLGGVALIAVGITAGARRAWTWLVPALFFFLIAVDLRALHADLWSRLEHLPLWRSQRVPSRFLIPAITAAIPAAAAGWQALLARIPRRPAPRALLAIGVAISAILFADLRSQSRVWYAFTVSDSPMKVRSNHAFGVPTSSEIRLERATPNRIVYVLDLAAPTTVVLPIVEPHGTLDWHPVGAPGRLVGGRLAVDLGAGPQRVEVAYTPPRFHLGVALSIGTVLFGAALEVRRRRAIASARASR